MKEVEHIIRYGLSLKIVRYLLQVQERQLKLNHGQRKQSSLQYNKHWTMKTMVRKHRLSLNVKANLLS